MKLFSSSIIRGFSLAFLAANLLVIAPLQAQPSKEAATIAAAKRVTIDLVDATIHEAAEFLANQFPGANFVVPPRVAKLRISLKLRNVTLDQALQAIVFATENRINMQQVAENVYGFQSLEGHEPPEERAACRIFSLATAPGLAGESDQRHKELMVELEKTIDEAIVMLRDHEPRTRVERPVLRFHPTMKLLVAVGKPAELSIVEQLVGALGGRTADIPAPAKGGKTLTIDPFAPGGVPSPKR